MIHSRDLVLQPLACQEEINTTTLIQVLTVLQMETSLSILLQMEQFTDDLEDTIKYKEEERTMEILTKLLAKLRTSHPHQLQIAKLEASIFL